MKAQHKKNTDFGKGACCSYEFAELGVLGPLFSSVFFRIILRSVELPQTTHPGGPNSTA